ncbi:unnamed protein product [Rhodiola kirilowii]
MGKDGNRIGGGDVEDGDFEVSNAVEKKIKVGDGNGSVAQEVVGSTVGGGGGVTRVWTMQDLYKHPSARGYSRDLHNFAWAQAVQKKKPLNEAILSNAVSDENLKVSVVEVGNGGDLKLVEEVNDSKGFVNGGVNEIDVKEGEVEEAENEKEEGELEEGEINMDMDEHTHEDVEEEQEEDVSNGSVDGAMEVDCGQIDPMDFDDRVLAILEALESVDAAEVEKSFEGVCSELLNTLKSLRELVLAVPTMEMDALVQLFLTAVTTVESVYCSMNQDQKEQHKEIFIRLLSQIKSQKPRILSPKQIKDIEDMMPRIAGSDSSEVSYRGQETKFNTRANMNDSKVSVKEDTGSTQFLKKPPNDSLANGYPASNDLMALPESLKISTSRSKAMTPLLDLHKDHDLDSLPSPTSKPTLDFSKHLTVPAGDRVNNQELGSMRASFETPSSVTHSFRTEALKAFSSYQQTFGGFERLPSPTPSDDHENKDSDCHGEVSSSFPPPNRANPSLLLNTSTVPSSIIGAVQRPSTVVTPTVLSSGVSPAVTTPARSRDPRLRYAGLDVVSLDSKQQPLVVGNNASRADPTGLAGPRSKVNRSVEGLNLDGPATKRQRNGLSNSDNAREMKSNAGTGGWLDDNATTTTMFTSKNQTASIGKRVRDPRTGIAGFSNGSVKSSSETVPQINNLPTFLPTELLENIAVNPTMYLQLLKNGSQQNIAREPLQKYNDPRARIKNSGIPDSVVGSVASANVASLQPPATMCKPVEILKGDKGVIRMKPRDPRRALLSGNSQSATLPAQFSTETKNNANVQIPEGQVNTKSVSSQDATIADIALKNTKNAKNVANSMACSLSKTISLVASQIQSSASTMDERKTNAHSMSEDGVAGPSKSQTTWNDVEHLFDGYDDHQRAAIQKERSKRLDEQKKMFAERKLCLVLDLDHTLLNSAKFCEIDPSHEELLRTKEELDREKPYRHLFRFPHMGMWTKLRPGIWNFLEKASKLFELHLYTMGNKLYASEMAKILDPEGILFAGRVISKGDDGDVIDGDDRVSKTKDLEGVLGMESSVVIIDDSIRVWPHNKLNLIVVERYIYFPCSRRQFGLPGPSLLEIDHDERPEDGTLASSLAVIARLHSNFFSHRELDEVDVRAILAAEQRKILRGCRIVFSRIFPVGEASPHLHPLWQTAEQFGASCTNQIDDKVTHIVTNSLGTGKVNWALSNGRFVVHPNWVEASALLYRRAKEQDFAIKP